MTRRAYLAAALALAVAAPLQMVSVDPHVYGKTPFEPAKGAVIERHIVGD